MQISFSHLSVCVMVELRARPGGGVVWVRPPQTITAFIIQTGAELEEEERAGKSSLLDLSRR